MAFEGGAVLIDDHDLALLSVEQLDYLAAQPPVAHANDTHRDLPFPILVPFPPGSYGGSERETRQPGGAGNHSQGEKFSMKWTRVRTAMPEGPLELATAIHVTIRLIVVGCFAEL